MLNKLLDSSAKCAIINIDRNHCEAWDDLGFPRRKYEGGLFPAFLVSAYKLKMNALANSYQKITIQADGHTFGLKKQSNCCCYNCSFNRRFTSALRCQTYENSSVSMERPL